MIPASLDTDESILVPRQRRGIAARHVEMASGGSQGGDKHAASGYNLQVYPQSAQTPRASEQATLLRFRFTAVRNFKPTQDMSTALESHVAGVPRETRQRYSGVPFAARPRPPQSLTLADGTVFSGTSIGASWPHRRRGGVQHRAHRLPGNPHRPQLLQRQIVTLTYPHIGNYGVNRRGRRGVEDPCRRPRSSSDLPLRHSNFRAVELAGSTPTWCAEGTVGIAGHRYAQD